MPTITGPILDSTGRPARGSLRVLASRSFEISAGLVTRTLAHAEVFDGEPTANGGTWSLPATPDGTTLTIEQDLDGDHVVNHTVFVPDVAQLTYAQLLYNRGEGVGGPNPYWWELEDDEFPATAVDGDWGYDPETDNVWRYTS